MAGLLSGSSTHCNVLWMAVAVAEPLSLKMRAAIHFAPGAMPMVLPLAAPATITPVVAVPWPSRSVGTACCPYGSNHEFVPPR